MARFKSTRGSRGMMTLSVFILALCVTPAWSLLCYQCEDATSNDQCNQEANVVDCSDEGDGMERHNFDTCGTFLEKKAELGVRISKRCVVGPCSLSDSQNNALGLDCLRTGDAWTCKECCQTDRCNVSGATSAYYRVGMARVWISVIVSLGSVLMMGSLTSGSA